MQQVKQKFKEKQFQHQIEQQQETEQEGDGAAKNKTKTKQTLKSKYSKQIEVDTVDVSSFGDATTDILPITKKTKKTNK